MLFENNYNKILLVDDDEDTCYEISMVLTDLGYDIYIANNGEQALKIFKEQAFPIVVTDLVMPKMNGMVLLKEIKKLSPSTEVIMISGYEDLDLVIESFRNEAIDFFNKPVDLKSLAIALNRAKEKIVIKNGILDYTEHLEKLVAQKIDQLNTIKKENKGTTKLKSLLDSLPLIVFLIDKDFKITALNNMYKQNYGDHTGLCCYRVGKQFDEPCQGCPALKSFRDQTCEQAEIKCLASDGKERSSLVMASPVTGVSNELNEVMIIAADLSKVKRINENLSSLGLMIGSVSHGIKGLLTGLDGGVYVLDSALKKQNQVQAEEGLNMVRKATSRMKNMVLDILFYSRERELKKEKINARQFANDLIKIVRQKAENHGIVVRYEFLSGDFIFKADSGVFISALINVVDNAIDACIEDDSKKEHEISLTFGRQENNVEITISDNGIGIDEADIDKIFMLFKSGKGKQGTGLGLFITDKTIRQHGGIIRVESEKYLGTKFIISIPCV